MSAVKEYHPQTSGLGIYVHFPWCLKKCPYCDFLSVAVTSEAHSGTHSALEARALLPHARYADSVLAELDARLEGLQKPWPRLSSIFFGGGTPSLWEPTELARVVSGIFERFSVSAEDSNIEVSVECNPTSFDFDHARKLLHAQVNRVSIGVQSLKNDSLAFLGRLHDPEGALRAVHGAVRAEVPRVSADLIFGVYKQSPEAAAHDVAVVAETGVTHVSAYALTIEPATRFGALHAKGKLPLLEESQVADSFEAVEKTLENKGFEHYEISNFALPGQYSQHNVGYWLGRDYLGLGTGAFGTVTLVKERLRYRNVLSPERYMNLWSDENGARKTVSFAPFMENIIDREVITPEISHQESLMLGLRTQFGVDLEEIKELRGGQPLTPERATTIERLKSEGKLTQNGARLTLNKKHWLFADGIIRDII